MTTMHLMRWSAAIENWHRIHYDHPFATAHDGLPGVAVNGSWKQHLLCLMLKDWVGLAGWVYRLRFQYRALDLQGDTVTAFGHVRRRQVEGSVAWLACDLGIKNSRGIVSTVGEAIVAVPSPDGAALPYPFPRAPTGALDLWGPHFGSGDDAVHRVGSDGEARFRPAGPGIEGPGEDVGASGRGRRGHLSADVRGLIGVEGPLRVSGEPIDRGAIRRFTQAMMDDDPVYWDEAYARDSRYGGVVAPPLFPLHLPTRRAGSPDPLAAALTDVNADGAGDNLTRLGLPPIDVGLNRQLNGGNDVEIFELARVGDLVSARSRILNIWEKAGASGALVFITTETAYAASNRDAPLLTSRQTLILH